MQLKKIDNYLMDMFSSPKEFASVCGVKNSMDPKFMLVADVLSEDIELFSEVIKEELNCNTYNNFLYKEDRTSTNPLTFTK